MNESPQQYFLTQAGTWVDRYGPFWRANSNLPAIAHKAKKLPDSSLDLIKHLALHTGWLWKHYPEIFTKQTTDLITPPDNISDLEGTQYDKAVLETIINRCARLPRREDTSRFSDDNNYYTQDFEPIIPATDFDHEENIHIYSSILLHEDETKQTPLVLAILLSDAWELYLRTWRHTNT